MGRILVLIALGMTGGGLLGLMAGGIWFNLNHGRLAQDGGIFVLVNHFPGWSTALADP